MLQGRTIILGITGSIAAIKAPIVARELMRRGAQVQPVLTSGAMEFTTPLALSALTRREAITDIFPKEKSKAGDAGTWHIHMARSADAMLIAPCSARTIGLLASGIYENAVTLLAASLPAKTPLVLAPAMDEEMWLQPAVQENLRTLKERGVIVIEPVAGPLASGLLGQGRMREPNELVDIFTELVIPRGPLSGKRVLITGGPTYEPIDAVRFIGNRSSGKMAAALAEEASLRGANVMLVMGPSASQTSRAIARRDVETASQMHSAVMEELPASDVIVMNAAVADFRPAHASDAKLKKREMSSLELSLEPTADILSEIAKKKHPTQYLVGFALEKGEGSAEYAQKKLIEKKLDMIVLNDLADPGAGFTHDTNQVTIYRKDGSETKTPLLSKSECAARILDELERSIATTQH